MGNCIGGSKNKDAPEASRSPTEPKKRIEGAPSILRHGTEAAQPVSPAQQAVDEALGPLFRLSLEARYANQVCTHVYGELARAARLCAAERTDGRSPTLRLARLREVCLGVEDLLSNFSSRGWLLRLLQSSRLDALVQWRLDDIAELAADMATGAEGQAAGGRGKEERANGSEGTKQLAAGLRSASKLQDVLIAHLPGLIAPHGAAGDPAAMKALLRKVTPHIQGASDSLVQLEIEEEAQIAAAALSVGPHRVLRHPDLQLFWWRHLAGVEELSDGTLWPHLATFLANAPRLSDRAGDTQAGLLILESPDLVQQLQSSVHRMGYSNYISAAELDAAFGSGCALSEQLAWLAGEGRPALMGRASKDLRTEGWTRDAESAAAAGWLLEAEISPRETERGAAGRASGSGGANGTGDDEGDVWHDAVSNLSRASSAYMSAYGSTDDGIMSTAGWPGRPHSGIVMPTTRRRSSHTGDGSRKADSLPPGSQTADGDGGPVVEGGSGLSHTSARSGAASPVSALPETSATAQYGSSSGAALAVVAVSAAAACTGQYRQDSLEAGLMVSLDIASSLAPLGAPAARRAGPTALSRLIGREEETERLTRMLTIGTPATAQCSASATSLPSSQHSQYGPNLPKPLQQAGYPHPPKQNPRRPLVLVTGARGCGKSALVAAAAKRLVSAGTWQRASLADLRCAADYQEAALAMALALEVPFYAADLTPAERLLCWLRRHGAGLGPAGLVLDNADLLFGLARDDALEAAKGSRDAPPGCDPNDAAHSHQQPLSQRADPATAEEQQQRTLQLWAAVAEAAPGLQLVLVGSKAVTVELLQRHMPVGWDIQGLALQQLRLESATAMLRAMISSPISRHLSPTKMAPAGAASMATEESGSQEVLAIAEACGRLPGLLRLAGAGVRCGAVDLGMLALAAAEVRKRADEASAPHAATPAFAAHLVAHSVACLPAEARCVLCCAASLGAALEEEEVLAAAGHLGHPGLVRAALCCLYDRGLLAFQDLSQRHEVAGAVRCWLLRRSPSLVAPVVHGAGGAAAAVCAGQGLAASAARRMSNSFASRKQASTGTATPRTSWAQDGASTRDSGIRLRALVGHLDSLLETAGQLYSRGCRTSALRLYNTSRVLADRALLLLPTWLQRAGPSTATAALLAASLRRHLTGPARHVLLPGQLARCAADLQGLAQWLPEPHDRLSCYVAAARVHVRLGAAQPAASEALAAADDMAEVLCPQLAERVAACMEGGGSEGEGSGGGSGGGSSGAAKGTSGVPHQVAPLLIAHAEMEVAEQRYGPAELCLTAYLDMLEAAGMSSSLEAAHAHMTLGDLYLHHGRSLAEAEAQYDTAAATLTRLYGSGHFRVGRAMLAAVRCRAGLWPAARGVWARRGTADGTAQRGAVAAAMKGAACGGTGSTGTGSLSGGVSGSGLSGYGEAGAGRKGAEEAEVGGRWTSDRLEGCLRAHELSQGKFNLDVAEAEVARGWALLKEAGSNGGSSAAGAASAGGRRAEGALGCGLAALGLVLEILGDRTPQVAECLDLVAAALRLQNRPMGAAALEAHSQDIRAPAAAGTSMPVTAAAPWVHTHSHAAPGAAHGIARLSGTEALVLRALAPPRCADGSARPAARDGDRSVSAAERTPSPPALPVPYAPVSVAQLPGRRSPQPGLLHSPVVLVSLPSISAESASDPPPLISSPQIVVPLPSELHQSAFAAAATAAAASSQVTPAKGAHSSAVLEQDVSSSITPQPWVVSRPPPLVPLDSMPLSMAGCAPTSAALAAPGAGTAYGTSVVEPSVGGASQGSHTAASPEVSPFAVVPTPSNLGIISSVGTPIRSVIVAAAPPPSPVSAWQAAAVQAVVGQTGPSPTPSSSPFLASSLTATASMRSADGTPASSLAASPGVSLPPPPIAEVAAAAALRASPQSGGHTGHGVSLSPARGKGLVNMHPPPAPPPTEQPAAPVPRIHLPESSSSTDSTPGVNSQCGPLVGSSPPVPQSEAALPAGADPAQAAAQSHASLTPLSPMQPRELRFEQPTATAGAGAHTAIEAVSNPAAAEVGPSDGSHAATAGPMQRHVSFAPAASVLAPAPPAVSDSVELLLAGLRAERPGLEVEVPEGVMSFLALKQRALAQGAAVVREQAAEGLQAGQVQQSQEQPSQAVGVLQEGVSAAGVPSAAGAEAETASDAVALGLLAAEHDAADDGLHSQAQPSQAAGGLQEGVSVAGAPADAEAETASDVAAAGVQAAGQEAADGGLPSQTQQSQVQQLQVAEVLEGALAEVRVEAGSRSGAAAEEPQAAAGQEATEGGLMSPSTASADGAAVGAAHAGLAGTSALSFATANSADDAPDPQAAALLPDEPVSSLPRPPSKPFSSVPPAEAPPSGSSVITDSSSRSNVVGNVSWQEAPPASSPAETPESQRMLQSPAGEEDVTAAEDVWVDVAQEGPEAELQRGHDTDLRSADHGDLPLGSRALPSPASGSASQAETSALDPPGMDAHVHGADPVREEAGEAGPVLAAGVLAVAAALGTAPVAVTVRAGEELALASPDLQTAAAVAAADLATSFAGALEEASTLSVRPVAGGTGYAGRATTADAEGAAEAGLDPEAPRVPWSPTQAQAHGAQVEVVSALAPVAAGGEAETAAGAGMDTPQAQPPEEPESAAPALAAGDESDTGADAALHTAQAANGQSEPLRQEPEAGQPLAVQAAKARALELQHHGASDGPTSAAGDPTSETPAPTSHEAADAHDAGYVRDMDARTASVAPVRSADAPPHAVGAAPASAATPGNASAPSEPQAQIGAEAGRLPATQAVAAHAVALERPEAGDSPAEATDDTALEAPAPTSREEMGARAACDGEDVDAGSAPVAAVAFADVQKPVVAAAPASEATPGVAPPHAPLALVSVSTSEGSEAPGASPTSVHTPTELHGPADDAPHTPPEVRQERPGSPLGSHDMPSASLGASSGPSEAEGVNSSAVPHADPPGAEPVIAATCSSVAPSTCDVQGSPVRRTPQPPHQAHALPEAHALAQEARHAPSWTWRLSANLEAAAASAASAGRSRDIAAPAGEEGLPRVAYAISDPIREETEVGLDTRSAAGVGRLSSSATDDPEAPPPDVIGAAASQAQVTVQPSTFGPGSPVSSATPSAPASLQQDTATPIAHHPHGRIPLPPAAPCATPAPAAAPGSHHRPASSRIPLPPSCPSAAASTPSSRAATGTGMTPPRPHSHHHSYASSADGGSASAMHWPHGPDPLHHASPGATPPGRGSPAGAPSSGEGGPSALGCEGAISSPAARQAGSYTAAYIKRQQARQQAVQEEAQAQAAARSASVGGAPRRAPSVTGDAGSEADPRVPQGVALHNPLFVSASATRAMLLEAAGGFVQHWDDDDQHEGEQGDGTDGSSRAGYGPGSSLGYVDGLGAQGEQEQSGVPGVAAHAGRGGQQDADVGGGHRHETLGPRAEVDGRSGGGIETAEDGESVAAGSSPRNMHGERLAAPTEGSHAAGGLASLAVNPAEAKEDGPEVTTHAVRQGHGGSRLAALGMAVRLSGQQASQQRHG